eukprot:scaffold8198_cov73-Isochrysis_galbana.AAC.2
MGQVATPQPPASTLCWPPREEDQCEATIDDETRPNGSPNLGARLVRITCPVPSRKFEKKKAVSSKRKRPVLALCASNMRRIRSTRGANQASTFSNE